MDNGHRRRRFPPPTHGLARIERKPEPGGRDQGAGTPFAGGRFHRRTIMGKVSRGVRRHRRAVGWIVAAVAAAASPPLAAQRSAADAAAEAHWVLYSRSASEGTPFAVVDARRERLWVYDGHARLVGASAIRLERVGASVDCTLPVGDRCIEVPAAFAAATLRPLSAGGPAVIYLLAADDAPTPGLQAARHSSPAGAASP